eukprot:538030_1
MSQTTHQTDDLMKEMTSTKKFMAPLIGYVRENWKDIPIELINLTTQFYDDRRPQDKVFTLTLDTYKLTQFIKSDNIDGCFQIEFVNIDGIEFTFSFRVNYNVTNNSEINISVEIKPIIAPLCIEDTIKCDAKVWSDDANIELTQIPTQTHDNIYDIHMEFNNKNDIYQINVIPNYSEYNKYLSQYINAINLGSMCFWCIPEDTSENSKYLAFLLLKNSRIQTHVQTIKQSLILQYENIEITEIRQWIDHDPIFKTKGILIDCKNNHIAHEIKQEIESMIANILELPPTHVSTICRYVLPKFADAFMEIAYIPADVPVALKPNLGNLKTKPGGPKYTYCGGYKELNQPSIDGMISNNNAITNNVWDSRVYAANGSYTKHEIASLTVYFCVDNFWLGY